MPSAPGAAESGRVRAAFMTGAIFGGAFMVTQYVQFVLGYSPLATGLIRIGRG